MNAPAGGPPHEMLTAYVQALRRRAFALYGVRALCAAAGGTSLALALAGALAGPVVTPLYARIALAALGLLACAILVRLLWPLRALRGFGSCLLLAEREPVLASRVRSALELQTGAAPSASPELIAAHARGVRDALAIVPPASVVPLRGLRHPTVTAGVCCALMAAALWLGSDAARSGTLALLSPAEVRADGVRVAEVVAGTSVQLVYPSYLAMPTARLTNPTEIAAPRGTTVELTVTPRLPARQGSLRLGTQQVRMSSAPNGKLFARFVARESSPIALRIHSEGHWYEDSVQRRLRAIPDARPNVQLSLPVGGATVEAREPVTLRYEATDDHGLQAIELVVRSQAGDEQRRRLWSSPSDSKPQQRFVDEAPFMAAEVGAEPGDVLLLWIEARDGDVVGGPNVGISKAVSIEVATDAQQLSLKVPLLREVLDGALDGLGDRLEAPLPEAFAAAAQRMEELHDGSERWLAALQSLIAASRKQETGLDLDQLQGVHDRTRREFAREAALYRGGTRGHKALAEADARIVASHERDVLLLADMLAQALVDEARALTQELSDLKQHMRELLQQLKRENSPEAQRALLSEIAKAQRRMRELAQSLARLSNRVPSEFINREALPQSGAKDTLDELRSAVESGDLDAAERQLAQLEQQIDELAQNIDRGGNRFREAHFGARDRALSEAQQQLQQLAAEQGRLADRTRDVLERTTDRAKARSGQASASPEAQQAAEGLEREIARLEEESPGSPERPWLERARERMRDAADAMRTGDLSEARRMAQAAGMNLEQAAASLEQDARMFPGHDGETWERAKAAQAASQKLQKLSEQLDRSLPQLGEHVGEGERRQLRSDVDPQRKAREQAESLGEKLGKSGDEAPLSPQGEDELREAADAMRRAERALDRGDPQSAAMAQDEAGDRLKQLEERLRERGQQRGRQSRGRREGGDGGEMARPEGPVRIPRADEFSGPMQMRRRLLDAMREAPPPEYEGAVGRYYEELLR